MNKFIFSLLFFVSINFSLFAGAGDLKTLDEKNGFRDNKLETNFNQFKDLVFKEGETVKFYIKKKENLTLGNYKLKNIYYGFYKNQLSNIIIETAGAINSHGVLDILIKGYGSPTDKPNKYIEHYFWLGEKVTLIYKENSITKDSIIYIDSVFLTDEREEEKNKNNDNAKNQL